MQVLCRVGGMWLGRPKLGNGRNTVSRLPFRKRELTEFCAELAEFSEELSEVAFAHKNYLEALSSLRGIRRGQKNSLGV